jgi:hypothetical protein
MRVCEPGRDVQNMNYAQNLVNKSVQMQMLLSSDAFLLEFMNLFTLPEV